jgi:hypothetical protein
MSDQKPSVGRIVHYVSFGTPGGEYSSECRAAVITGIHGAVADGAPDWDQGDVHLAVLNPEGMFFNKYVNHDEDAKTGGTWHWPERV